MSMRKLVLLSFIILYVSCSLLAQNGLINYETSITVGGMEVITGTLFQTKDSSVIIANTLDRIKLTTGNFDLTTINFDRIYHIKITKKKYEKRVGFVAIGSLVGAVVGFFAGILGTKDSDRDDLFGPYRAEVLVVPLLGIPIGGLMGGLIGNGIDTRSVTVFEILIIGNFDTYIENREKLEEYSFVH